MDGSGRVSNRNRRFLRVIRPYKDIIADLEKGRVQAQQSKVKDNVTDLGLGQGNIKFSEGLGEAGNGSHVSRDETGCAVQVQLDAAARVAPGTRNISSGQVGTSHTGGSGPTEDGSPVVDPHVAVRQETESHSAAAQSEQNTSGEQRRLERESASTVTRPVRNRKKPDFLVVGDINDPRFNRGQGR